jgi:hypothetical protein
MSLAERLLSNVFTAGWGAFMLAALKALPALISLISAIKVSADASANQGIGYDQAVADTLKKGADMLAVVKNVEQQAERDHATKQDDTAFDTEFQRKD